MDAELFSPLRQRPWFLKEAALEDWIWSCPPLVRFICGNGAKWSRRQICPLGSAIRADLVAERNEQLVLVELEKDGKHKARGQLLQQAGAFRAAGVVADGESMELVGVDWRPTNFRSTDFGIDSTRSMTWKVGFSESGEMAFWVIRSGSCRMQASTAVESVLTRNGGRNVCREIRGVQAPFQLLIWDAMSLLDRGLGQTRSLHVKLASKRVRLRDPGRPYFYERNISVEKQRAM
ncbi:MAG TPA: hypothetical protein QGF58_28290, partial [Myxococcota bacterium]|nr:hypothetical protein [Myxococcota bacterium]